MIKVGTKIKCINVDFCRGVLTLGNYYTITRVGIYGSIDILDDFKDRRSFSIWRFKVKYNKLSKHLLS